MEERHKLNLGLEYLIKNETHTDLQIHIRKKKTVKNFEGTNKPLAMTSHSGK